MDSQAPKIKFDDEEVSYQHDQIEEKESFSKKYYIYLALGAGLSFGL